MIQHSDGSGVLMYIIIVILTTFVVMFIIFLMSELEH